MAPGVFAPDCAGWPAQAHKANVVLVNAALRKSIRYAILIGLDALCAAWTFYLMGLGTNVLLNSSWKRSLVVLGVPLLLLLAGIVGCLRFLLPKGTV